MTRSVYIVRHGNTFDRGDTVTRVGARPDLPLSRSGQEQARNLAAHFSASGVQFTEAVAGPLRRTVETAEAILAEQENPPRLQIEIFLREIDYGPDENRPEEDVVARLGEGVLHRWETQAIVPPGWQVDPDALVESWRGWFASVGSSGKGPVLCVTSNGIARFARFAAEAAAPQHGDLKLKTGAFARFEVAPDGTARIAGWNIRP